MSKDDDTITNKVLLDHMQAMQSGLERKIDGVKNELKVEIGKITKRMDGLERKIDLINTGIDNIDQRVEQIEIRELPKIKQHVGIG